MVSQFVWSLPGRVRRDIRGKRAGALLRVITAALAGVVINAAARTARSHGRKEKKALQKPWLTIFG